jgi:hypothetical protein
VIVSTLKGVEYILINGKEIVVMLIKILKQLSKMQKITTDPIATSVNLRFSIAIMQKISIKS